MYGIKCPKCGLMQLPKSTCKACGSGIEASAESRPKPSPRAAPKAAPKTAPKPPLPAPPKAALQAASDTPLELEASWEPSLPPPIEKALRTPPTDASPLSLEVPSEDRSSRTATPCSECGMPYFEDELVRLGDGLVCGRCKPLFVQKLREGVAPAGEMVYAGFWIRFGARIIDSLILGAALLILFVVGGLIFGFQTSPTSMGGLVAGILQNLLSIGLSVAYGTYFLGKYSATPGKMACGLKVVRPDGEKITYARAVGRFFADWLNSFTIGIGYIMAAFDEEKRALHDRICDTRVVRQP